MNSYNEIFDQLAIQGIEPVHVNFKEIPNCRIIDGDCPEREMTIHDECVILLNAHIDLNLYGDCKVISFNSRGYIKMFSHQTIEMVFVGTSNHEIENVADADVYLYFRGASKYHCKDANPSLMKGAFFVNTFDTSKGMVDCSNVDLHLFSHGYSHCDFYIKGGRVIVFEVNDYSKIKLVTNAIFENEIVAKYNAQLDITILNHGLSVSLESKSVQCTVIKNPVLASILTLICPDENQVVHIDGFLGIEVIRNDFKGDVIFH